MTELLQYIANGFMVGGVYALIALGIVLIYKSTSVFNFAVGHMMMFGAFFCWTFIDAFKLPTWLGLPLCLIGGAALGLLIERLMMRPLIGQPILSSIAMTLVVAYLLGGIAMAIWGVFQRPLPEFLPGGTLSISGVVFSIELVWSFFLALAIFGILALFYQRTRTGLAMRATAEDHQVAQARGISVRNVFGLSWALAGMVAVAGGILLGYQLGVSQYLSLVGLRAFPAVLLGGLESIPGAVVGGILVGILENLVGGLINPWLMDITPYIVVLLVLIIRPDGLFGLKRIERI